MLALVVVGWGWLLTHTLQGSIEGTDDDVSRWFAGQRTSWLDPVADVGTLLGETPVGLAVGAVVAVVAGAGTPLGRRRAAGRAGQRGRRRHLLAGLERGPARSTAGAHPRPGLVPDHSFPSGHVGTAVAVYGGAALLLLLWLRSRDRMGGAGRIVVVLLACLPLFVAVSRLYQGAHHLTDVGTSLVYGAVWLAVLAALLRPGAAQPEPAVSRSAGGHADAPVPHR